MAIKNGIILYTIERDGCLNGVYTHEAHKGKIFNEIARKIGEADGETIYASAYFEVDGQVLPNDAALKVSEKPDGVLRFSWVKDGKEIFFGDGYKMNDRQIAVIYHAGKRP